MAGAVSNAEKGGTQYQDHTPVVACPRSLIQALRSAVLDSFASRAHGGAEVYGVLFGTHSGGEVRVEEFQNVAYQSALAGGTPLSTEERNAFAGAIARSVRSRDPNGVEPVGWFRSHPHSELGLTPRDLEIANTYFPGAHQVVMILRASDGLPSLVKFYYRKTDGPLKTDSPYSEFAVPLTFDVAPVSDTPGAQEVESPVPALSLDPPPAEPPRAAPLATVAPVDAPQDNAVTRFEERPPMPHRKVSLFWPSVLAALVVLAVAIYWLTRPPDRLALRVFDTVGQLRILWDPVANAESGHLEIVDGDARLSIELHPEQLLSGSFTYARRSGNVSVRLVVQRPGTAPLAEEASYLGRGDSVIEQSPPAAGGASREKPPPDFASAAAKEKPSQLVVAVPVKPFQPAPLPFKPPAAKPSPKAGQTPELSSPPAMIAQSTSAPPPVARLSPPAEKPPAAATPAALTPAATTPAVTTPPVTTSANTTPAVTPARAPAAPASGRIIWIGRLQKNQEVVIAGKSCSSGTLIGELPGKPLKFSISPGDLSSGGIVLYTANPEYANNVIESPGPRNGWNQTSYTWSPKYANEVAVKEAPSAQNQWNRLTLQSKNPKIAVIVIDWTLAN